MLYVGRTTTDGSDEGFYLDASRSRAAFICGKRGSGKSYTLGVILEELALAGNVLVIVVDPMGIFHTMRLPNDPQRQALWDWNLGPSGVPVRLLPPGDPESRYPREVLRVLRERDVDVRPFRINPSDLSNDGWLELFGLDLSQPMGMILQRALQKCRARSGNHFYVPDIVGAVTNDPLSKETSAQALTLRLETAANEWDLFTSYYQDLSESFVTGVVNILDLSVIDNGRFGLRNLVLSVLVRQLFARRRQARSRVSEGCEADGIHDVEPAHHAAASANRSWRGGDYRIRFQMAEMRCEIGVAARQLPAAPDGGGRGRGGDHSVSRRQAHRSVGQQCVRGEKWRAAGAAEK